jgi:hypothetical protein
LIAFVTGQTGKNVKALLNHAQMLFKQARLPGYFIADPASGLVLPQFLHLYPAWLALWDAVLGVQLGLYATPLIALLGSVAFYFLARELFGQSLARLAFFLLVVTVPAPGEGQPGRHS